MIRSLMIPKAKAVLREKISAQIAALSHETKKIESAAVGKIFLALPEFQKAKVVGFYASAENEIDTDGLIKKSFELGKRIAIPRVKNKNLDWREIFSLADLAIGEYDLRQPSENLPKLELAKIDLLVVPGMAFTISGARLGRGWGCYDRDLAHFTGQTISLAFRTQLEKKIPTQPHDQKIGKVLVKV